VVTVTFETGDAGATFVGAPGSTTATTDGAGLATFAGLGINGLVGNYTLRFAAPGLGFVVSGNIAVTPGAPASLTITTQPSSPVTNDVAFAQQPVIQVNDGSGNGVPGVVVTASLNGGGTLGGTVDATTDATGAATYADLKITGLIGDRTIDFTAGLLSATSGTVTVEAGAFTQLIITREPPAAATADTPFALAEQPLVQLADVSGNAVATAAIQIDATLESGTGTLGGTLTQNTDATGLATYTDLSINNPGATGAHTIRFTATVSGFFVISATITLP
jgi:hypothetical protein